MRASSCDSIVGACKRESTVTAAGQARGNTARRITGLLALSSLLITLAACTTGATPPTNDPPTISLIGAQQTSLGVTLVVPFTVGDEQLASLALKASSSDQALVADAAMSFSGVGSARELTLTPSASSSGSAQITITATDQIGQQASVVFALQVTVPFSHHFPKLLPDGLTADDRFGAAVAVDGEYAIVGSPLSDLAAGIDAGAAYVFRRDGEAWSRMTKLTASDAAAGDQFGAAVAISGDHVVVGAASSDPDGAINAGAAYVFRRDGNSWTQVSKLIASDSTAGASFGEAVGISGDHAIVGASLDAEHGASAGAAYVFQRFGDAWAEVSKLTASDAAAFHWFGASVGIHDDYAVVGAYQSGGTGAAYVFRRVDTVWTEVDRLTAIDASAGDVFGASVAMTQDTLIVGAQLDAHAGGAAAGAAYVFERSGLGWVQVDKLTASDAAAGDWFGASVGISGENAIVGSPRSDHSGGMDAGAAYLFRRSGGHWSEVNKLVAPDADPDDRFGLAVGISGSLAIVGSPNDSDLAADAGSAYVLAD